MDFSGVDLSGAILEEANLSWAYLRGANLHGADLSWANLHEANLEHANLVQTKLGNVNLTGCRIYDLIAWGLMLNENTKQRDLVITTGSEPNITVDNIEVAQFI